MVKKAIFFLFFILGAIFFQKEVDRRYFDRSQIGERKSLRILLLHRKGVGEKEAIARIQLASKRLGWECYACSSRLSFWEKMLFFNPLERVIQAVQPDFTINFQSDQTYVPGINFASLSSGIQTYARENFDWSRYTAFDAFLPTCQETDFVKKKIESLGKPFYGMRWFFTCPRTPFVSLEPKRVFYCGSNWDRSRKGETFKCLFKKLDQRGDFSIYGPPKAWKHTPLSYRGFLPFDGTSTLKAMQECGIVLILHSDTHLKGNAPTGRIFEAAAASCVVISDRHPFVLEEFKDSVLYINQEGDSQSIFQEIESHVAWIRSHPKEAREMALRCHQIFEERFLLEDQLLRLKAVYEKIPQTP